MFQNLFRYTRLTLSVVNAGGTLGGLDEVLRQNRGNQPRMVIALDAYAGVMSQHALSAWVADTLRLLRISDSALVLFDERLALACGRPLPRRAGLTALDARLAVVTRIWTVDDTNGHTDAVIVGPVNAPRPDGFHGSTWTHGLVTPDDIERVGPSPLVIMDSQLPARRKVSHSRLRDRPTDQFAWRLLDRAHPRAAWVRAGSGGVEAHSPTAIHRVGPGETSVVDRSLTRASPRPTRWPGRASLVMGQVFGDDMTMNDESRRTTSTHRCSHDEVIDDVVVQHTQTPLEGEELGP